MKNFPLRQTISMLKANYGNNQPMLKELLLRDFGKDLKIAGGAGNSVDDPILIEVESAHDASWTEMEIASCIYGRLGWHWRAVGRAKLEEGGKLIEKLSCEVKYIEADQLITETRNFFFDLSNVDMGEQEITPACGFNLGSSTGMGLPYQLGWFHFTGLTNNEEAQAGMGVSAAYSAPTTQATVYVYNKGLDDIKSGNESQLEAEFASAINDLLAVHTGAKQVAERFDNNLLFAAFEMGTAYSIITLSGVGNHFFKIRATVDPSNEKYSFDCLWDSVNTILAMTKPRAVH